MKNEPRVEKALIDFEKYYSHTDKGGNYEKLHEYVYLVMAYSSKLVDAHGLGIVLDSLTNVNLKAEQFEKVGDFVKRLFPRLRKSQREFSN